MARRRSRGQALVEFALVAPIFVSLLVGIVDLGRVVWASNSLASAAREGARFAIVHGGSANDLCPVGPPGPDTNIPAAGTCPFPVSPSKDAVKTAAVNAAVAGGTTITATVCYGAGCTGDTDATAATNVRGTPVTVTVTATVPLAMPSLVGIPSFSISGSSTMLVNH